MSLYLEVLMLESILRRWRADPATSRRDYRSISSWKDHADADDPLPYEEVMRMKERLRELAPTHFRELFPEG